MFLAILTLCGVDVKFTCSAMMKQDFQFLAEGSCHFLKQQLDCNQD